MRRTISQTLPELPGPDASSIDRQVQAFDAPFEPLRELLGADHLGYRNHCLRVYINVCAPAPTLEKTPVIPALVFHDIGLWTHRTVDYWEPSAQLAREYLSSIDRTDWIEPSTAMILWHHKQRVYRGPHAKYVNPVRRGDMGDYTFGLQGGVLREGRGRDPNAGFHRMLLKRTLGRLSTKPLSPAPMMRW